MTELQAAVAEVTTPTTFNFAEAVVDRSYPEFRVPIYLDEAAVQALIESQVAIEELETVIARTKTPTLDMANRLAALQAKFESASDALKSKEYVAVIKGISPEESIRLEEQSYETFPREYEESQSPITGARVRTEIPNDKRDEEFVMLLRQAHLVSVTAPGGAVDSDWSELEKVRAMIARLPLVARAKIDEAINKCTITVDFYRNLVDEVF